MSDLLKAGLMASLLEGGGLGSVKPLTEDEFKTLPCKIADLKIGDKLRYLGNGGYKLPKKGDTVIVASLDAPMENYTSGSPIRRKDFTSFFKDLDDGDLLEWAFDSRYFERV